ncbi:hypothetical protein GH733_007280 [Mirounga leonina]|nr:hypothetical protein GH733_007280 [Mirounga leonina]
MERSRWSKRTCWAYLVFVPQAVGFCKGPTFNQYKLQQQKKNRYAHTILKPNQLKCRKNEGIQRADSDTGELGVVLPESTESLKGDGGVRATNSSRSGLPAAASGPAAAGVSRAAPPAGGATAAANAGCAPPGTSMAGSGWISANVVMVVGSWISLGIK